jgi:HAD superfamily hydrolase (TIGR01509 family)
MDGRALAAVIFDMDGVLIDSEPLHYAVLRGVLAEDGYSYSQTENEQFLGTTTEAMFATMVARHHLPSSTTELDARYHSGILRELRQPREPQAGVRPLVMELRARGVRLAVASSSRTSWIVATLASLRLSDAFPVVVSGDDITHAKPDPSIYVLAADRLGVPAEHCVAIEDSPNGVTSAHRAGMWVLGVRTPYTTHMQLPGANRVIDSLADLDLSSESIFSSTTSATGGPPDRSE